MGQSQVQSQHEQLGDTLSWNKKLRRLRVGSSASGRVWGPGFDAVQKWVPYRWVGTEDQCMSSPVTRLPFRAHSMTNSIWAQPCYSSAHLFGLQLAVAFERIERSHHKNWNVLSCQESLPENPACHLFTWKRQVSERSTNVPLSILRLSVKLDFKGRWRKQVLGYPMK